MYKAYHKTLPRSIQVYFTQMDETHGSGSGQEFFKRGSLDPLIPACVSAAEGVVVVSGILQICTRLPGCHFPRITTTKVIYNYP